MGKIIQVPINLLRLSEKCHVSPNIISYKSNRSLIQKYGQTQLIQVRNVDKHYKVIHGEVIYRCLKEMMVETALCYEFDNVSEEESTLLSIMYKESSHDNNYVVLCELIWGLKENYTLATLADRLPFTKEELEHILTLKDFDWENFSSKEDKNQLDLF